MPQPARQPRTVADRMLLDAIRQQLGLYRYQEGVVRAVLALLRATEAELERQIRLSISRRRQSLPVSVRLRLIREELRRAMAEGYRALGGGLVGELEGLAERVATSTASMVENALPFAWSATRPNAADLAVIATANPFQGRLLAEHVAVLQSAAQARMLERIRVGLVAGETNGQIISAVFGDAPADGTFALARHQVAAWVRTSVQHVHAEAREMVYEANADVIQAVMAIVTLDELTCRKCGRKDGKVWTLDGKRPVGHREPYEEGPGRWHMQCRCTSIPVLSDTEAWEAAGIDLSGLTGGERASIEGPVSSDLDYEDWLQQAPRDVRVHALGVRRADWWEQHPDVSLARAWEMRFGGTPMDIASMDEALGA